MVSGPGSKRDDTAVGDATLAAIPERGGRHGHAALALARAPARGSLFANDGDHAVAAMKL